MKSLLILGAGQFGQVVKEIAEANGYSVLGFLDDHAVSAMGKLGEMENFRGEYDEAIVAIDDPFIRVKYTEKLEAAGYTVPVLVHPLAYVAPSAQIGKGSVIEPMACVHTGSHIGQCCIVSVGAVVNHHSLVGDGVHVSCNSTVMQNTTVKSGTTTLAGQLYFVEPSLKNSEAWMQNYSFDAGV